MSGDRLPGHRRGRRRHGLRRCPDRGPRGRRDHGRPASGPRGALAGRLPLRPAPSTLRQLRRQLDAARSRPRRPRRPEPRLSRAGRRRRDLRVLRRGDAAPPAALGPGPVLPDERVPRRSALPVAPDRPGVGGGRAPSGGRRDRPGVPCARHRAPTVRGGRRGPLRPGRGPGPGRRPAGRLRDHRRGQDGDGCVHLAARTGHLARSHHLDPAPRRLAHEPRLLPARPGRRAHLRGGGRRARGRGGLPTPWTRSTSGSSRPR